MTTAVFDTLIRLSRSPVRTHSALPFSLAQTGKLVQIGARCCINLSIFDYHFNLNLFEGGPIETPNPR